MLCQYNRSAMRKVYVNVFGGGLGNLLFMHHAGYALAKAMGGAELCMRADYVDFKRPNITAYRDLFAHVSLVRSEETVLDSPVVYHEPAFTYSPLPLPMQGDLAIQGYFQSYKYVVPHAQEIRDTLWANVAPLFSRLRQAFHATHGDRPTVCVHVRRGDYLHYPHIYVLSSDAYYAAAMAAVRAKVPGCRFVVFSDDVPHVRGSPLFQGEDVHVEEEPDVLATVILMSLCDHFVIANSSLSMNGYLLRQNDDALVYAPKQWFVPGSSAFDPDDVLPPNTVWID